MTERVHDPELLDALERMQPEALDRIVWRVAWASRNPLAGGTGGGRWHPANDFEALYTSLEEHGAVAEAYYHLARAPVFSSSHMKLHKIRARTARTLIFEGIEALEPLGVDADSFRKGRYARMQEIGAAARFLDIDGLMVPSARWPCSNLVLFLDRLPDLEALRIVESADINWPAWREKIVGPKAH